MKRNIENLVYIRSNVRRRVQGVKDACHILRSLPPRSSGKAAEKRSWLLTELSDHIIAKISNRFHFSSLLRNLFLMLEPCEVVGVVDVSE